MFAQHRTYRLTTGLKGSTIAVIRHSARNLSVLYHSTIVLRVKGSQVLLDNGGWDTISTRHVINTALSELRLGQLTRHKGITYLNGTIFTGQATLSLPIEGLRICS